MLIWAYAGGGGASTLEKAKSLFTSVVIGILIIYCAWLIVFFFLDAMGVAKWTGFTNQGWTIQCGAVSSSNNPSQSSSPSYGQFNGGQGGQFNGGGASGTLQEPSTSNSNNMNSNITYWDTLTDAGGGKQNLYNSAAQYADDKIRGIGLWSKTTDGNYIVSELGKGYKLSPAEVAQLKSYSESAAKELFESTAKTIVMEGTVNGSKIKKTFAGDTGLFIEGGMTNKNAMNDLINGYIANTLNKEKIDIFKENITNETVDPLK